MKGVVVADTSMLFDDYNIKILGVSYKRKVVVQTNQTQEMIGAIGVDIPMMEVESYSKIGVSSSRNKAWKISETKQVYGVGTIDMPIMEAIIHNENDAPSLINVYGRVVENKKFKGHYMTSKIWKLGIL